MAEHRSILLVLAALLLIFLDSTWGQCPSECSCVGSTSTMNCDPRVTGVSSQFTIIPQDGPQDIRIIIMSGNLLSTIASGSFSPYPFLETLVLNDNIFTTIPSEGFTNLPITNLTFDGNPLIDISQAAFSNLTSLQHLSISRTPTLGNIIGREAFEGLDSLISLRLDNNLFQALPGDLLGSIPQLNTLSLKYNSLQTLPSDFLSPLLTLSPMQIDLSFNPWSCDCYLEWLRAILDITDILANDGDTLCHWPPPYNNPVATPISQVTLEEYQCYAPVIITHPTNATFLSNASLVIPCEVDSAPFPEVLWIKDDVIVNLTSRVHISRYNAALQFENFGIYDSGVYQCVVENENGTAASYTGAIVVLESTCFDNAFTRSHETDLDCGGDFCVPCNITQGCLVNTDCVEDLVCLYTHSLPSSLHYISSSDPMAFTCAEPSLPQALLEGILQSELPYDIYSANVSGGADTQTLHSTIQDLLAIQLEVSRSIISNVRLSSVEKTVRPLIQLWFDLPKTLPGQQAGTKILDQINSGDLKATVRIKEDINFMKYRLNL